MSNRYVITGCEIFDGKKFHQNAALVYSSDEILGLTSNENISADSNVTELTGGFLAPGFIDLQVNGGGGVLLNEQPNVGGIHAICATHAKFGTTGMLPTLITDRREITTKAIEAGIEAHRQSVPGFLGLHLEGPHLSIAKKGAHDASLIRRMDGNDVQQLLEAAKALPCLMITVAPDFVSNEQITQLANVGIIVSLGHSDASFKIANSAIDAGAKCVTHLYNAMSPLTHQEPGMVGTALMRGDVYCGLIADGHHVKSAAISIALAAKKRPGGIFLVTDAMSTIGTDIKSFTLNGRKIIRQGGRLELEDGTLAGADLDMASAVRFMHQTVGLAKADALNMAALIPARCIGISNRHGHLGVGARANFVHFDDKFQISQVWQNGRKLTL